MSIRGFAAFTAVARGAFATCPAFSAVTSSWGSDVMTRNSGANTSASITLADSNTSRCLQRFRARRPLFYQGIDLGPGACHAGPRGAWPRNCRNCAPPPSRLTLSRESAASGRRPEGLAHDSRLRSTSASEAQQTMLRRCASKTECPGLGGRHACPRESRLRERPMVRRRGRWNKCAPRGA